MTRVSFGPCSHTPLIRIVGRKVYIAGAYLISETMIVMDKITIKTPTLNVVFTGV